MFAFNRNLIYLTKAPLLNYVARRSLKTATRDISKGNVIEYKDRHFIVTKVDSHFTGRGVSTTKFELKDAITGQKLIERVKPNDSFEGGEKSLKLLDDNMNLTVAFIESEGDNQPVTIRLPLMYAYTVVSDTPKIGHSTKAQKVIEIKGGIQVQVPEFVNPCQ
ncbi:4124_t:CDS:2 [Diversispora eburnea]|uniref:4124_t:CDS:1 n=1 Tax=Diversispora eburnea TaxID=1213867 RepID=A0A9N8YRQ0_9GLOM|nr:4124_t:CDS:2 [Diversispora eburnea]